jgi:hypothetical protein
MAPCPAPDGYPPNMQMLASETVLKQAELIAEEIAAWK